MTGPAGTLIEADTVNLPGLAALELEAKLLGIAYGAGVPKALDRCGGRKSAGRRGTEAASLIPLRGMKFPAGSSPSSWVRRLSGTALIRGSVMRVLQGTGEVRLETENRRSISGRNSQPRPGASATLTKPSFTVGTAVTTSGYQPL